MLGPRDQTQGSNIHDGFSYRGRGHDFDGAEKLRNPYKNVQKEVNKGGSYTKNSCN